MERILRSRTDACNIGSLPIPSAGPILPNPPRSPSSVLFVSSKVSVRNAALQAEIEAQEAIIQCEKAMILRRLELLKAMIQDEIEVHEIISRVDLSKQVNSPRVSMTPEKNRTDE